MRFSVWPINQQPYDAFLAVAEHAERTGWDGVWVADHLMPSAPPLDRPVLECWTTMSALLAAVPRLRVGSLVCSNTFRHPAVVAKMAATLAHQAPGRFVLGMGTGWQTNEHAAYGITYPGPGVRLAMLDEACTVIRRLLTEESVDHAGQYYPLAGATVWPRGDVPMLIGVKGPRALAVAAAHADEWNYWAVPETVREKSALFAQACERIGRDPAAVRRSVQALLCIDGLADRDLERWRASGMPILTGSAAEITERIGEYRDAGIDELIVPDWTFGEISAKRDTMDAFISEIAADFREAT
jgi:alkanesulfonate monooxygenase SsuD/methylene tetrahydromethanopterin reductase-like flavin-dependent oxidoreductase (luciferase family)